MTRRFARLIAVPVVALLGFTPTRLRGQEAPAPEKVNRAIERGVAHLRAQQAADGHWNYGGRRLGITALCGLALMESGVGTDDESIVKATEVVKSLASNDNQTYELALAILFLARVQASQRGPNDPLIRQLARRLAHGSNGGIWNYTVPVDPSREQDPVLGVGETLGSGTVAPQREGVGTAPGGGGTGVGILPQPKRRPDRPRRLGPGDHSNTQFALLGLWAASRHGFDSSEVLAEIDEHFRDVHLTDGHWGYQVGNAGSPSMTCAGLMGLTVAAARPALAERTTARARGAALAADSEFISGLGAVKHDARGLNDGSDIYYLWSLERICVALGLRDLDGFDWYAAGAQSLLRRQTPQGNWSYRWGDLTDTSLALLFLRKANLAFEIDRVLRLPRKGQGGKENEKENEEEKEKPEKPGLEPSRVSDGEARVVVTGASDAAFPEIAVDFEVRRPDGTFVVDAAREDFQVTEDAQPVEVLRLQSPVGEARPTTVVLVVDRSLSMENEDRIGGLKRAVATFLAGLPRGSRVAVIAFGSDVVHLCPFTDDFAQVRTVVEGMTPAGATRYFDAVSEALEMLQPEKGRRAVLAMTDGEDTFSQSATLDSVIAAARRLGLPVHTLGLGSEDEIESDALKQLATSTRGEYYPAREADQLRKIYEELAERLRSSYSLVYRSDRKLPDGTLRPVRISYRSSRQAGETSVFIPGMVVPAAGWPRLFLALASTLLALAYLPGWLKKER